MSVLASGSHRALFLSARAPLTHTPPHTLVSMVSIAERTLSAVCNVIAVTAVLAVNRIDVLPSPVTVGRRPDHVYTTLAPSD